jgi:prophage regulatory protein
VVAASTEVRFIRFEDLAPRKGIPFSRPHVVRLQEAGAFPLFAELGSNTVALVEAEVDAWIAERLAARRARLAARIQAREERRLAREAAAAVKAAKPTRAHHKRATEAA